MRWKHRILIAASLSLVGVLVLALAERMAGERRLKAVRERLLSRGEKLEWQDIAPLPPKAEENGYRALMDAAADLSEGEWVAYRSPPSPLCPSGKVVLFQDIGRWISGKPDATGSNWVQWADFKSRVDRMEQPLREARQALEKPYLDSLPNYSAGFQVRFQSLITLKRLATCLSAKAASDLRGGRSSEAVDNLEGVLLLAHRMEREPLLISQLVQVAIQGLALSVSWQLIQAREAHEEDLARLQKAWLQSRSLEPLGRALEFERFGGVQALENARSSNANFLAYLDEFNGTPSTGGNPLSVSEFVDFLGEAPEQTGRSSRAILWRHVFAPADEAGYIEILQSLIELHRAVGSGASVQSIQPRLRGITNTVEHLCRDGMFAGVRTLLSCEAILASSGVLKRGVQAEVQRRLVVTAIALRRFQLRNATYPKRLQDLVPDLLPAVLMDPYDGLPLHYSCPDEGNSFLLYSVGADLVDNAGAIEVKPPNTSSPRLWQAFTGSPDVTWPMPASESEAREALREIETKELERLTGNSSGH